MSSGNMPATPHQEDVAKTEADFVEDTGNVKDAENTGFVENTIEEKNLVRKIDLYLMPTIWILYLFSFMDRTNISNARVAGMAKDLHLTDHTYYLAITLFLLGYILGEIPSNMILVRSRPSIYIPILTGIWGVVAAVMAAVQTPAQLIACRFILGLFEAGFSPSVVFLISTWYRKSEQSKRVLIYLSAGILSGAFGGVVAGSIASRLDGSRGIAGWRWLFLVEGVVTVGLACFARFGLLDFPTTTKKFTLAERDLAYRRLKADGITNQEEGSNLKISPLKALSNALSNWRVWLLAFAYMPIQGVVSIAYSLPTLVKGLGYSAVNAQFMTAPVYVVSLMVAIPICWYADHIPNYRALIAAAAMAAGAVLLALTTGIKSYTARYVFICFVNSAAWTTAPLGLSYSASALAGADPEMRAISLALIIIAGTLAQYWGTAIFPTNDAPDYILGFSTDAALSLACCFLYLVTYFALSKYPFKYKE